MVTNIQIIDILVMKIKMRNKYRFHVAVWVIISFILLISIFYCLTAKETTASTFGTKERRSFIRNALKGYTATEDNGIYISEPIIVIGEYENNNSAVDSAAYAVISETKNLLCFCNVSYSPVYDRYNFGYSNEMNEHLWDVLMNGEPFALYRYNAQYVFLITEEAIYPYSGGDLSDLSQYNIPECELKVIEFVPLNP